MLAECQNGNLNPILSNSKAHVIATILITLPLLTNLRLSSTFLTLSWCVRDKIINISDNTVLKYRPRVRTLVEVTEIQWCWLKQRKDL